MTSCDCEKVMGMTSRQVLVDAEPSQKVDLMSNLIRAREETTRRMESGDGLSCRNESVPRSCDYCLFPRSVSPQTPRRVRAVLIRIRDVSKD